MQQRPGVITELVLAFFGRRFDNNIRSGAKNGKKYSAAVYKRLALDVQSISVSSLNHGNQYFS